MSQQGQAVPRIRSLPGLRDLYVGFLAITAVFGLLTPALILSQLYRGVDPYPEAMMGMGTWYLLLLLVVFAFAMSRPTLSVTDAGLHQTTTWTAILGVARPRGPTSTLLLWRELRRLGLALELRPHGVMACGLTIASAEATVRVGISDRLAVAIVDAVLARRPDIEVEPAAGLVIAELRRQGPSAVRSRLQSAACRFAMDRGIYRLLHVRRHWWDQIRTSPELKQALIEDLGKYFP